MACPLARVRLSDIAPYEGAPGGTYGRAVEALAGSLMRHNAALIELGSGDAALMRCGLEAARLYFRSRAQQSVVGKGSRGVYTYRAGRYLIFFFFLFCLNCLLVYRRDGCLFGAENFPSTWTVFAYLLCNMFN
jgi:hypothetical protein